LQILLLAKAAGGSGTYTYAWTSNPPVTFSAPNAASTFVTLTAAATYTITSTVSDGSSTAQGVTTVTVTQPPPPLAVTATVDPPTGQEPLAISLSAAATGGSGTYTYAWTSNPAAVFSAPNAASTTAILATAGDYTIEWMVSDGTNLVSGSRVVTVAAATPSGPGPTAPGLCGSGLFETMLMGVSAVMLMWFGRRRWSN
jgi:hypothetical protein